MKRYALSSEAQHDLEHIRAYDLEQAGARVARHVLRDINAASGSLPPIPVWDMAAKT